MNYLYGLYDGCSAIAQSAPPLVTELVTSRSARIAGVVAVIDLSIFLYLRLTLPGRVARDRAQPTYLFRGNAGLTEINVTHNPRLRELNVYNNQLTEIDVTHNLALTSLALGENRLTQINVTHNPALECLAVDCNQLTEIDVTHNLALNHLQVARNRLTQINVTHNLALDHLCVALNRLTTPPDVSQNHLLQWLNLDNNQLTTLHDSVLDLSANCRVLAEDNRFSPEYVAEFQERLRQRRLEDPTRGPQVSMTIHDAAAAVRLEPAGNPNNETLNQQLRAWTAEFRAAFPDGAPLDIGPLLPLLTPDEARVLSTYLQKLRFVSDYTDPVTKNDTIRRVIGVLQQACGNAEFRGNMLALVHEGIESCGDRVALVLNDIEIQSQLLQPGVATRPFLIRVQRYRALKKYALKEAETRRHGEQIEAVLYYLTQLQRRGPLGENPLDMPIVPQGMLYPRCSGVTPEMLQTARAHISAMSDVTLLGRSDEWQARMEQQYPDRVAEIKDQFGEIAADAWTYYDMPEETQPQFLTEHPELAAVLQEPGIVDYDSAVKRIGQKRDEAIAQLDQQEVEAVD